MYWISSTSMNRVIDIDTLEESCVSLKEIVQLIKTNQIVPNIGSILKIKYNPGCDQNSLDNIKNIGVSISDIDADVLISSKEHCVIVFNNSSDSWRRNRLIYSNLGIEVVGNGIQTYVYYEDVIYILEGIDVILGLFLDAFGALWLRYGSRSRECLEVLSASPKVYTGDIRVMCFKGTVSEMKRIAVLGGI